MSSTYITQHPKTQKLQFDEDELLEEEIIQWVPKNPTKKPTKKSQQKVCLEAYVEADPSNNDLIGRTKSLTDDDLDELKGCVDLGFGGFNYEEIPELCNTLPALELCYSMSLKFNDDQHFNSPAAADNNNNSAQFNASNNHNINNNINSSNGSSPMPTWKISSPGDHPEDVKARLKFWAQAVACTVKLCSS